MEKLVEFTLGANKNTWKFPNFCCWKNDKKFD